MAGTEDVGFSGNSDIDAILWDGVAWNTSHLTFSFPGSASFYGDPDDYSLEREPSQGFTPFTEELEAAARKALSVFASFANLTFTEITETASIHADLRFAMADIDAAGHGYFPSDDPVHAGDVWLDTGSNWGSASEPQIYPGSRDFKTIMHELGHVLGLSHPSPSQLPPEHDGWDYTIMAYNAYPGQDPEENTARAPQTPMLADVAALQHLYGANFKHNNTDTVYRWSPTTGEMFVNGEGQGEPKSKHIYMTLWDGGGVDTYDFSNYTTDVRADLRPGEWSSPSFVPDSISRNQTPVLESELPFEDSIFARGNIANAFQYNGDPRSLIENAKGGIGDDTFIGNSANNLLIGSEGDDRFFYTGGFDSFHGEQRGAAGDEANFSMFGAAGVIIVPTISTIKLGSRNVTVSDESPLADSVGNAYLVDAVYGTGKRGIVDIAALKGIENLVGTHLDDDITGNRGDNIIEGLGGADRIRYLGGYDDIDGGRGVDTIDFSGYGFAVSVTLLSSVLGSEAFTRQSASFNSVAPIKAIAELESIENAIGTKFDDLLRGSAADNKLDGGLGQDTLFYGSGFDTLIGNKGTDTADFSRLQSAISVDLQRTGPLQFEAMTNFSDDVRNFAAAKLTAVADLQTIENLKGSMHHDALLGNSAANTINGLGGDDVLTGRGGRDTFAFESDFGHDVITDFANGDRIDLSGLVDSFADLEISVAGSSTLIRVGVDSILLQNVGILQVQANDFLF